VQRRELTVRRPEHFGEAAQDLQFFSGGERLRFAHGIAQRDHRGRLHV